MTNQLEIKVGRTYRAKRPRGTGTIFQPLVNDRTVIWIGMNELQYDGPAVKNGSHYPRISLEKFRAWAERDVTDELPPGEYAEWPILKREAS
ncbi:hypothetical protein ELP90_10420 [Enterobacter hormaechei subsp. xiangfangensis]|uniref:hypothetical protein n=1 Tax=Enterobacter cloacae TaxID=550 RepID=UPI000E490589|nr:hypothetical protein [Enterobacter cloacae]RHI00101.1 hypothetical protein DW184_19155 [Enterobacter cloacae]RUL29879.1 hypothetical protein ELP90_10420 [Enterobacter hormaechei subsp. xiangfangensis]